MAKKKSSDAESLYLGNVSGELTNIRNVTINYVDNNDGTTAITIVGSASSAKTVNVTIEYFLYDKASDSDSAFIAHQPVGPYTICPTARLVQGGFLLPLKNARPKYARLQLFENWFTEQLCPKK